MNFQNIPRDDPVVKRAFIPKREILVEFDYHQIEPRLFGYFSAKLGMPRIADMYKAGMDVYREMAAQTHGITPDEVTAALRQSFKVFFLMILYGAGPKKIAEEMDMTLKEARAYYSDFHEAWPEARLISNPPPRTRYPGYEPGAIERVLKRKGHIDLLDGRPIPCPQWGEHKMLNYLIQGSAAVVMKRALIRVWKRTRGWPLYAHPNLTVHDSILMDALESELPMLVNEIPQLMVEPLICDTIPVVAEVKWSDTSWADMKEYAA